MIASSAASRRIIADRWEDGYEDRDKDHDYDEGEEDQYRIILP